MDICKRDQDCPPELDGLTKAYCVGTLPRAEAAAFDAHYVACSRCATAVERAAPCELPPANCAKASAATPRARR
jgi:hypothetical protein